MSAQSDRADRFVRQVFNKPKLTPAAEEQQQAVQTRADKLKVIAQRAVQRRKRF
jgi:hypothetical protein